MHMEHIEHHLVQATAPTHHSYMKKNDCFGGVEQDDGLNIRHLLQRPSLKEEISNLH
jgi:hypothetical protein